MWHEITSRFPYITASIRRLQPLDCLRQFRYLLPSSCLSLRICTIIITRNKLPNTIVMIPAATFGVVFCSFGLRSPRLHTRDHFPHRRYHLSDSRYGRTSESGNQTGDLEPVGVFKFRWLHPRPKVPVHSPSDQRRMDIKKVRIQERVQIITHHNIYCIRNSFGVQSKGLPMWSATSVSCVLNAEPVSSLQKFFPRSLSAYVLQKSRHGITHSETCDPSSTNHSRQ